MAMPASGDIGLKFCTAQACSSICVATGYAGTASLSSMSIAAGSPYSTAPYCMREFYSYVPKTPIDFTQYVSFGTLGVSSYVYRYYCVTPTPAVGQTYSLCIRGDLCTVGQQTGSWARVCVTCNGLNKYCCCVGANICAPLNVWAAFTVDSNDCIRVCNHACATNTACQGASGPGARSCIYAVTGTYHCKGTTCTLGYVYTA